MIKIKDFITFIKSIFPRYLLLLVLIPVIIGYIIDFEASDKFGIVANLIWIPIFTIPFYITKKKVFYNLVVVFYFIVGFIEITHWFLLKGPLSITSLFMVSNTNYNEASEFLGAKLSPILLLLIPYCFLFYLALKRPIKMEIPKYKFFIFGLILFILGLFFYLPLDRFLLKVTPQISRVSHAFIFDLQKYYKAISNNHLKEVKAQLSTSNQEQLFVLIIGEAASRNHMSLYNYQKNTNPKLSARKDNIIFDNVVSGYSNTISGVMSMITESNIENKLPFYKSIDLIDVFHAAGFKTYWISNQPPFGWAENLISSIGNKSTYSKFVNVSNNSTYEGIVTSSFDEKLFEPFSDALNENVSKKFIILHLMGNHLLYNKRYPMEYNIFNGKDDKDQMVAEYDNSMLYNDFVIDSLLNIVKQNNLKNKEQIASAIYVSDHGENVYDEKNILGHHFVKTLLKSNVEIPMLVWLSPSFIDRNNTKVSTIISNKQKPFVADDIFHSILDINSIKSPLLDQKRSIFNANFDDKRIRILVDGKDYDKKLKYPKH